MDERPDPHIERARTALERLRTDVAALVADLDAAEDLRAAFDVATELSALAGEWEGASARRRAEIAAKIYEVERLSLAGLAAKLSLSKPGAQRLYERGTGRERPKRPAKIEPTAD